MFVRKKKNRSGSVSVVVVDKSHGRFSEIRQFGVAHTEAEADALVSQARRWILRYGGQQQIDFDGEAVSTASDVDSFVERIGGLSINGTYLLLSQVYDRIGFDVIKDEVLRHLVIARISQPSSKLATVAYLRSYYKEDIDLSRIYRYMDKLYNSQMELLQEISIHHTRRILGGNIVWLGWRSHTRRAGLPKTRSTNVATTSSWKSARTYRSPSVRRGLRKTRSGMG